MVRGSMIIEMTVALALLTTVGLVVLKSSLDVMAPRQWVILQNISDSYMSYEQAYAERVSFDEFTSDSSDWPVYPDKSETAVVIGRLPGGTEISATVVRTRVADTNNLSANGGTGTLASNPAEMETWQLMSHLVYRIGGEPYRKSRTVLRTR